MKSKSKKQQCDCHLHPNENKKAAKLKPTALTTPLFCTNSNPNLIIIVIIIIITIIIIIYGIYGASFGTYSETLIYKIYRPVRAKTIYRVVRKLTGKISTK